MAYPLLWILLVSCLGVSKLSLSQLHSKQSELRPGYGLLYNYQGQILPNTNSYWLIAGIEIPKPRFPEPLSFDIVCGHLSTSKLAEEICNLVRPIAADFTRKQDRYHAKIQRIINHDIPALMPNYEFAPSFPRHTRDTSQDSESSEDRFIINEAFSEDLDEDIVETDMQTDPLAKFALDYDLYNTEIQSEINPYSPDVLLLPPPLIDIFRKYNITMFDDLPTLERGAVLMPRVDKNGTAVVTEVNLTRLWNDTRFTNIDDIMSDDEGIEGEGTREITEKELFVYTESPDHYTESSTSAADKIAPTLISSFVNSWQNVADRIKRYLEPLIVMLRRHNITFAGRSSAPTTVTTQKLEVITQMTRKQSNMSNLEDEIEKEQVTVAGTDMTSEKPEMETPVLPVKACYSAANRVTSAFISSITDSMKYVTTRVKRSFDPEEMVKLRDHLIVKLREHLMEIIDTSGPTNTGATEGTQRGEPSAESLVEPPEDSLTLQVSEDIEYGITREKRFLIKLMRLLTRHNISIEEAITDTIDTEHDIYENPVITKGKHFLKSLLQLLARHNITVTESLKDNPDIGDPVKVDEAPYTSAAPNPTPSIITQVIEGTINVVKRVKRGFGMILGQVAQLIVGGVNMYLKYKKETVMKQSIDILRTDLKDQKNKIVSLQDTMTTIAKTSFKKFTELWQNIVQTNHKLEKTIEELHGLGQDVLRISTKVADNRQAIRVLAYAVGRIYEATFTILHYYDRLLTELYHKLDGLETLATGRLSHSLIEPEQLKRMLRYVEGDLQNNYVEYELAIREVNIYYDLPTVSYTMVEDMIVIQIPIYVKHYNSEKLELFHVTSVPVPFHADTQYPEANGRQPYTRIVPKHDMLAMSDNKYMSMKSEDVQYCKKISDTLYCENLLLVTHKSEHTCESAIYWNASNEVINEKCDIEYAHEYLPQPQILDTGKLILLAGLPGPWSIFCNAAQEIPVQIQAGPYVLIERKYLCLCAISAGPYYLQETISSCTDDPLLQTSKGDRFHYLYTINTAVAKAFGTDIPQITEGLESLDEDSAPDLMIDLHSKLIELSDKILVDEPVELTVSDCKIHAPDDDDDVLNTETFDDFIGFEPVFEAIKRDQELYMNAEDKAADMAEISSWFSHYVWFALMFLLSLAGTIGLILAIYAIGRMIVMKGMVNTLNSGLTKIVTTLIPMEAIKPVRGQQLNENKSQECYEIFTWQTLGILIGWEVLAILCIWLIFCIGRLIIKYRQQDSTMLPSKFLKRECCAGIKGNDVSDVYMELSSILEQDVLKLFITTVLGTPTEYTQKGTLKGPDVSYKEGILNDYLYIEWDQISIWCGNELIYLPGTIVVSVLNRGRIKAILMAEDVKSRMIMESHNKYHVLIAGDDMETTSYRTSIGDLSIISQVAQFVDRSTEQVQDLDEKASLGHYETDSPEDSRVEVTKTKVYDTLPRPPFLDQRKPRTITCSFCNNKLFI